MNNNSYSKSKILMSKVKIGCRYVTKSKPCFLQRSATKKDKHECPHEDIAPPGGATNKSIKWRHRNGTREKGAPNALPWWAFTWVVCELQWFAPYIWARKNTAKTTQYTFCKRPLIAFHTRWQLRPSCVSSQFHASSRCHCCLKLFVCTEPFEMALNRKSSWNGAGAQWSHSQKNN